MHKRVQTSNNQSPSSITTATKTSQKTKPSAGKVITPNYTYALPKGWALLDKSQLSSLSADSGIAQTVKPNTRFAISTDPVGPDSSTFYQAKSTAYSKLSANLPSFQFVSETNLTISGQPAIRYTYTTGQVKQQMNILIYKSKVYSLLCTANLNSFDTQVKNFDKILSSFRLAN